MAPTAFFVNIYYLIIVLGCILSTPSFVVIVLKLLVFLLALSQVLPNKTIFVTWAFFDTIEIAPTV